MPPAGLFGQQVFLEVFAGLAVFTEAMRSLPDWVILPPIELEMSQFVLSSFDVLDPAMQAKLAAWWPVLKYVHFGTPCTTMTRARKHDGKGPPPLRSDKFPNGLPKFLVKVSSDQRVRRLKKQLMDGNKLAQFTLDMIARLRRDQLWSVENPANSLLWKFSSFPQLMAQAGVAFVQFAMCAYGSESLKPTALLTNIMSLRSLAKDCPGCASHVRLTGQEFDEVKQKWVHVTKRAQVYPAELCSAWAMAVGKAQLPAMPLDQGRQAQVERSPFEASFSITTPAHERKRPLGKPVTFRPPVERGKDAVGAGLQARKGLVEPLYREELEPGEAVRQALQFLHPLAVDQPAEPIVEKLLDLAADAPHALVAMRGMAMAYWQQRAEALRMDTVKVLNAIKDKHVRRLLCGNRSSLKGVEPFGTFLHWALWQEMAQACGSVDAKYLDELLEGLPIVGLIARSGRWPDHMHEPRMTMNEYHRKAWATRKKIEKKIKCKGVTKNSKKIWDNTIEDRDAGYCLGPFYEPEEVDEVVKDTEWVPTERMDVEQKNKVREVDSATVSLSNQLTAVTEKLKLPSTDRNVGRIRRQLKKRNCKLKGWILDEKKAYRQIPVRPAHRKFTVITLMDPVLKRAAYFVMISHSFGLTAAVYNYNRRSALLNEIMNKIFFIPALSYYDDKFGFEEEDLIEGAHEIVKKLHTWLGAGFDEEKCKCGDEVEILGVTFDFKANEVKVKEQRKADIMSWLQRILDEEKLTPGEAGKLKGVLQFASSQIWGKVGRAFLRSLSERQYDKSGSDFSLNGALKASLIFWKYLISKGPARPMQVFDEPEADIVIFTDGFWPDESSTEEARIGAVVFDKIKQEVSYISVPIKKEIMKEWMPRKTQVSMIEMLAPVIVNETFKSELEGKKVLLFVDSECVEGALVKGYSAKEDLCWLNAVFWQQALKMDALFYIDRVSTDANISDGPSRGRDREAKEGKWQYRESEVPAVIREGLGKFLEKIIRAKEL